MDDLVNEYTELLKIKVICMPEDHCNLEKQFLWLNLINTLESNKKGGKENG